MGFGPSPVPDSATSNNAPVDGSGDRKDPADRFPTVGSGTILEEIMSDDREYKYKDVKGGRGVDALVLRMMQTLKPTRSQSTDLKKKLAKRDKLQAQLEKLCDSIGSECKHKLQDLTVRSSYYSDEFGADGTTHYSVHCAHCNLSRYFKEHEVSNNYVHANQKYYVCDKTGARVE